MKMAIIVVAVCLLLLTSYIAAYVGLCGRSDVMRSSGTRAAYLLRGYRWSWCPIVFAPAAWVEACVRGREVALTNDADWLPFTD